MVAETKGSAALGCAGAAEAALLGVLFVSCLGAGGLSGEHRQRGEVPSAVRQRYGGARLRARSHLDSRREFQEEANVF